jgi:hypothetical protein
MGSILPCASSEMRSENALRKRASHVLSVALWRSAMTYTIARPILYQMLYDRLDHSRFAKIPYTDVVRALDDMTQEILKKATQHAIKEMKREGDE